MMRGRCRIVQDLRRNLAFIRKDKGHEGRHSRSKEGHRIEISMASQSNLCMLSLRSSIAHLQLAKAFRGLVKLRTGRNNDQLHMAHR